MTNSFPLDNPVPLRRHMVLKGKNACEFCGATGDVLSSTNCLAASYAAANRTGVSLPVSEFPKTTGDGRGEN